MKTTKKIFPIPLIVGLALVVSCCFYVQRVKENLGLLPNIKQYEGIRSAPMTNLRIRYFYFPKNLPKQEIAFEITDAPTIANVQKVLVLTSVSPFTLGVDGDVRFFNADSPNGADWWNIRFRRSAKEILIAHTNMNVNYSSCAILKDEKFYNSIFELARNNNRQLFPNSTDDEIKLWD